MEFNASRILKIEKKRNGGREGAKVEEGFVQFGRKGLLPVGLVAVWTNQSSL